MANLAALQAQGKTYQYQLFSEPGEVVRPSRLLHEHVNMLGRYNFTLPKGIAAGQLRPLRDPTSLEEQLTQLP